MGNPGLGAFTTFSTFGIETIDCLRKSGFGLALGNVAANSLGGLAAVAIGMGIIRWWPMNG